MQGYESSAYGDAIADTYDAWHTFIDTTDAVELLARVADGRRVLELGVGTGRIAIPLAERGLDVVGVDASERMLAQVRAKPGGDRVQLHRADFGHLAAAGLPGSFGLVSVVFNTLYVLPTQDEQVSCFQEVARLLEPGGAFVVEAYVPDPARYDRGQRVAASRVEAGLVVLDATRHDPVTQQIAGQHVVITAAGVRMVPMWSRYIWPAELDLMARLAGLTLADRFDGWDGQAYTATSGRHVSVYRKP